MLNTSTNRRLFRRDKKPPVDTDGPPRKHVTSVTGRVILGKASRQCHESTYAVTPAVAADPSPVCAIQAALSHTYALCCVFAWENYIFVTLNRLHLHITISKCCWLGDIFCSTYHHFKSKIIILSSENRKTISIRSICQLLKFQIPQDIFSPINQHYQEAVNWIPTRWLD
jgi:hypothetical protein